MKGKPSSPWTLIVRNLSTIVLTFVASLVINVLAPGERQPRGKEPSASSWQAAQQDQGSCSTNKECIVAHGGKPYICQQATRSCIRLTSPECTLLAEESDISDDNTVWIGFVANMSERPLRQFSVDLARKEFLDTGGLPPAIPGGPRRPYALVSCDSTKGIDPIFNHLIKELKLPAVIGPVYSAEALRALTEYAVAANVVLMSTATAEVLTTTPSNGLFFRMLPSDALQAHAYTMLLNEYVESKLRSNSVLAPGEQMKVFVAYRDDVYGQAFSNILRRQLRFNGQSASGNGNRFQIADLFADPANRTDGKYKSVVAKILTMQPHVIAIIGSLETDNVITAVEKDWPTTLSYKPFWVGTDAVGVARLGPMEASLPQRFLQTNIQINFEATIAQQWLSTLASEHPETIKRDPRSPTALGLYDSVYAMAYAVTLLGSQPLTGPNIARALRRLNQRGAPVVSVGKSGIRDAFKKIEGHQSFDLQGATGPLNWDPNGNIAQDIDVLCVKTTADDTRTGTPKIVGMKPSGMYYDANLKKFVGRITACPGW